MNPERTCERCGHVVGNMSDEAWKQNHFHCDDEACIESCDACLQERAADRWAEIQYQAGYAYACGYKD